jgi:hypothetical protein
MSIGKMILKSLVIGVVHRPPNCMMGFIGYVITSEIINTALTVQDSNEIISTY